MYLSNSLFRFRFKSLLAFVQAYRDTGLRSVTLPLNSYHFMKLYRCKFLYAFLSSLGGDQRVLMRYFLSLCFRVKGRGKALRLGAELLWRLKQLCLGLTTFWKKIERQSKNVACSTTVGQHHWAIWPNGGHLIASRSVTNPESSAHCRKPLQRKQNPKKSQHNQET